MKLRKQKQYNADAWGVREPPISQEVEALLNGDISNLILNKIRWPVAAGVRTGLGLLVWAMRE